MATAQRIDPASEDWAVIQFIADSLTEADRLGNLAADFLERLGFAPGQQKYPESFLIAIAAIARLELWELLGMRDFISADLPTSAQAYQDLLVTMTTAPEGLDDWASVLISAVFNAWFLHTARSVHCDLGAEFALSLAGDHNIVCEWHSKSAARGGPFWRRKSAARRCVMFFDLRC